MSKKKSTTAIQPDVDAIVIGAGFAGLYAIHRLRNVLGLNIQAFEAGAGVGGTWYWNRYPGARCDSESYYYCYSFSKELIQEWDWSSRYPAQAEILSYLEHVAERFDLSRSIQFNTRVASAIYDEANNLWEVTTESGDRCSARYLVSAVGCLSSANIPDIKGLDTFEGEWFHSGAWPHHGVDFSGKRVGQVGTGSTGIQAAPVIAAQAKTLTVFQRTPSYTIPARNRPYAENEYEGIKANYADTHKRVLENHGAFPFPLVDRAVKDVDEQRRQEIYEQVWGEGGFAFLWNTFNDLLLDLDANETACEFIRQKIRATVDDPDVAERLSPRDYPYGAKRPPIDTNYYETYNRDNVSLVDIKESPIVEVTAKGVRTESEEYELDTLVFATGFDALTGSLLKIDIRGVNGQRLSDKWSAGPRTYLGLQMAGFPNFFTITGPGSPSVLVNMPVAIEQHVDWISDCITHMREHGHTRIEPIEAAQDEWVDHVNEMASMTLYPQANSWYLGANIPGKTRIFMPYAAGLVIYRERCDSVASEGYTGFQLGS